MVRCNQGDERKIPVRHFPWFGYGPRKAAIAPSRLNRPNIRLVFVDVIGNKVIAVVSSIGLVLKSARTVAYFTLKPFSLTCGDHPRRVHLTTTKTHLQHIHEETGMFKRQVKPVHEFHIADQGGVRVGNPKSLVLDVCNWH